MKPFKLILVYARNYIPSLTVTALSMLALVGVQLLIPWIVKNLIGAVTEPGPATDTMQLVNQLTIIALGICSEMDGCETCNLAAARAKPPSFATVQK